MVAAPIPQRRSSCAALLSPCRTIPRPQCKGCCKPPSTQGGAAGAARTAHDVPSLEEVERHNAAVTAAAGGGGLQSEESERAGTELGDSADDSGSEGGGRCRDGRKKR